MVCTVLIQNFVQIAAFVKSVEPSICFFYFLTYVSKQLMLVPRVPATKFELTATVFFELSLKR